MGNYQENPEIAIEAFHRYALGVSMLHSPKDFNVLPPDIECTPELTVNKGLELIRFGLTEAVHSLSSRAGFGEVHEVTQRALTVSDSYYDNLAVPRGIAKAVTLIRPNPLTTETTVRAIILHRLVRLNTATLLGCVAPHPSLSESLERYEQDRLDRARIEKFGSQKLKHAP